MENAELWTDEMLARAVRESFAMGGDEEMLAQGFRNAAKVHGVPLESVDADLQERILPKFREYKRRALL